MPEICWTFFCSSNCPFHSYCPTPFLEEFLFLPYSWSWTTSIEIQIFRFASISWNFNLFQRKGVFSSSLKGSIPGSTTWWEKCHFFGGIWLTHHLPQTNSTADQDLVLQSDCHQWVLWKSKSEEKRSELKSESWRLKSKKGVKIKKSKLSVGGSSPCPPNTRLPPAKE